MEIHGLYEVGGLWEVGQLRGRLWSMSIETGLLACNEEYGHPFMIVSC